MGEDQEAAAEGQPEPAITQPGAEVTAGQAQAAEEDRTVATAEIIVSDPNDEPQAIAEVTITKPQDQGPPEEGGA